MTRINLIDHAQLCDKHLMAEYRELIRIPNGVISGKLKSSYPDAPKHYVLGAGHIKFFVNKLQWLFYRHQKLHDELEFRGFNVTYMVWIDRILFTPEYEASIRYKLDHGDYVPTPAEIQLNISRLIERMPANPRWTNRDIPDYWRNHNA